MPAQVRAGFAGIPHDVDIGRFAMLRDSLTQPPCLAALDWVHEP